MAQCKIYNNPITVGVALHKDCFEVLIAQNIDNSVESMTVADCIDRLLEIYKHNTDFTLDTGSVDNLIDLIRLKINYFEGNLTRPEYVTEIKKTLEENNDGYNFCEGDVVYEMGCLHCQKY